MAKPALEAAQPPEHSAVDKLGIGAQGCGKGKADAYGHGYDQEPICRHKTLADGNGRHDQPELGVVGQCKRGKKARTCPQPEVVDNEVIDAGLDGQ